MRAVENWKRRKLINVSISVVPVVTLLLRPNHQPLDRVELQFTRRINKVSRRQAKSILQWSVVSGRC